jgi:hypothetical protein
MAPRKTDKAENEKAAGIEWIIAGIAALLVVAVFGFFVFEALTSIGGKPAIALKPAETREVGGADIGRLLQTLSEFLRQDARTRAELEARQSWTVNAARLAVCAPWIVLLLLGTQPSAVAAYQSAAGGAVLLGGLVASVVCYRVMLRIGALPEEKRVFA